MKTYEMVALAEKSGRTYKNCAMYYNKGVGFFDAETDREWDYNSFSSESTGKPNGLYRFIMCDGWEICEKRKMTKEQIEEKLGFKIEIIEDEEDTCKF